MKLLHKDILVLLLITTAWLTLYWNTSGNFKEALKYFPMHLIITILFYAIIQVCYNILIIKDCKSEYSELLSEIEEARKFYNKN